MVNPTLPAHRSAAGHLRHHQKGAGIGWRHDGTGPHCRAMVRQGCKEELSRARRDLECGLNRESAHADREVQIPSPVAFATRAGTWVYEAVGATGFELVSKPRSLLAPTCGRYPSSDVVATQSWTPEVAAQLHEWLGICRVQQNFPPRAIRESFETPVLNNIQESILGQDADSVRNNLLVATKSPNRQGRRHGSHPGHDELRSEERRVGKECRARGGAMQENKKWKE